MPTGVVVRKNEYYDSVFLMRVAKRIGEQPGVTQVAALMGTEKNKGLLAEIDVSGPEVTAATPNDLILAVKADSPQAVASVLARVEDWLRREPEGAAEAPVRTLDEAVVRQPQSNLAVISVPGQYAAREARRALEHGLNVFLFSDNVPLEDELALKQLARERGLIVMGPDCGTALIGGVGIGFANAIRRGPIGVIGASGTGIQELTTLVHRAGSGISHAIGVGSRDLSDAIGGISTLSALAALEADPGTQVIAILSKPPGPAALATLTQSIGRCRKPVIACFLGLRGEPPGLEAGYHLARTLDDAAALALETATGQRPTSAEVDRQLRTLAGQERARLRPGQRYIRGLFAGGTFCYQAQQILQEAGVVVHSNAPLEGNHRLADANCSREHTLIDMGADEFTVGRPHPMIDSGLRRRRILAEAQDPQVAILLLDVILGYNASPDPAGELASAIAEARSAVARRGGYLSVIASICGTEGDPQGLQPQHHALEGAGAIVLPSSAQAARLCAMLANDLEEASRV